MKNQFINLLFIIVVSAVFLTRCTDDETLSENSGTLNLKITDAASDDEEIKGIFITIKEIKIEGKPIRNFQPKTIEISDLKNGETELLISKELAAKEHEQISLVLATEADVSGKIPGCYVLTTNNTKHDLFNESTSTTEIEIPVSKTFELLPSKETNLVIDFDLRKAIIRNTSGKEGYSFVTLSELENALRIVNEEDSGVITGEVKANFSDDSQIYLLVYRKGEFEVSVEGTGAGKSKVLFSKAVAISKVEPDGKFSLAFIEEGDYVIRVASFKRNSKNVFVFNGFLLTTSKRTGMLLNNVSVSAGAETELNVEVFSLF